MNIDILGTTYTIKYVDKIEEGHTGKTDFLKKEILFLKNIDNPEFEIVYKHEIIHAFLYESGLIEYCKDETLVDYFAMQWDKLNYIYAEVIGDRAKCM